MLVWHKLILKCRWPYKSEKCIAKTEFIFNLKVVIIISLTKSGMNFFDWFVIVFALKYVDQFWCGVTLIPNNELFSNFTKRYQITLQINLHNDVIIISMVNILFHSHMCGWTFKPLRCIEASFYIPEISLNSPTTRGFGMKISMKLVYLYMAIFINFPPTLSHLHQLQVENSSGGWRWYCKVRLERVNEWLRWPCVNN